MGRNWFGLSFGPSIGGIIGNPLPNLFFQSVGPNTAWSLAPTIPFLLFALFQAKFAIITPALITGAFERIRFGPICYSWFYFICHMTWYYFF
jgi:Amt family ammonium transporter